MKINFLVLALATPLLVSASAFASGTQFRCTAVTGTSDYLRNTPGYGYALTQDEAARQALANCFSDNGSDPANRCSILSCEAVKLFAIDADDTLTEYQLNEQVQNFNAIIKVNADAPPGNCFYNSHGPGCPF